MLFHFNNFDYKVQLIRSTRKSIKLTISNKTLIFSIPSYYTDGNFESFLKEKKNWIVNFIAKQETALVSENTATNQKIRDYKIEIDGKNVPIKVVRSNRKNMSLYIRNKGLIEIKAHYSEPDFKIIDFLEHKKKWIIKHLTITLKEIAIKDEKIAAFIDGGTIYYLEQPYLLSVKHNEINYIAKLEKSSNTIYVESPDLSTDTINHILTQWEQNFAVSFVEKELEYCLEIFRKQVPTAYVKSLKVHFYKSKLGSCDTKGNITINSKLIRYNLKCLRYIIFHELCHLVHFNHSKAFYDLQVQFVPNYKDLNKILGKSIY